MSLEENKTLVRRFYEAISYDGDLAVLDDICVPTYAHRIGGEQGISQGCVELCKVPHCGCAVDTDAQPLVVDLGRMACCTCIAQPFFVTATQLIDVLIRDDFLREPDRQ